MAISLLVTSAGPGEGKSTSVANLAITMAQMGTRTLLVDADLSQGHRGLGQVFLARRMGRKKLIAETGAGQHGVATATAAARVLTASADTSAASRAAVIPAMPPPITVVTISSIS